MSSPWCQCADIVARQALVVLPRYLISPHLSASIWVFLPCTLHAFWESSFNSVFVGHLAHRVLPSGGDRYFSNAVNL